MQEFRRFVRGPAGKVLLVLIILPFVISGFYGYFTGGGGDDTVAEVEGNKITGQYVSSRTQQLRQMLRQQSPDISQSMLDSFVRPQMVLEGIINEQLMIAAAHNADMAFADQQAAALIRSNPSFAENGQFSEAQFERTVRSQGMTPQGYMDALRQERISEQYRNAFAGTDFALPGELAEQRRLGEQRRDIRYTRLAVNDLRSGVQVSDEEVEAFYQDNQDDFMNPEKLRLSYVMLSPSRYQDQSEISDQQIEEEYQARKQMRESATTRREVAHILIEVGDDRDQDAARERAAEVRRALDDGESFEDLAAEYSDDAGSARDGGNLGRIGEGDLPESLEQGLSGLGEGDVSEPVVSDAGVHLLKVNRETRSDFPPLEELREEIVADLRRGEADGLLSEDLVQLEELVYEHPDLDVPAEQLGLELETTDWVSLNDLPEPLDNDRVRQALDSDDVRNKERNSEVLDLGQSRYLALRLEEVRDPEPMPLDEVAGEIRSELRLRAARERAESMAGEARSAVEEGADLEQVARMLDASVSEETGLQRGAGSPDADVVNAAFSTSKAGEGASEIRFVNLRNGDLVAFQVTAVEDGDVGELSEADRQQALQELARTEGEQDFRSIMAYLRENLDVDVNADRLGQDGGGNRQQPQQPQPQAPL